MQNCEKCREEAATVFIKRVQGKHKSDLRLCEACAREQALSDAWLSGQSIPEDAATMPLDELLLALLSDAPDPDSFAPEDDKWSLQKLAAFDHLHSTGEFSGDEDLDDSIDEMDDEDDEDDDEGVEMTPEEIQAALDEMEPHEREAVNQMLEALDEVQDHLEQIMTEHAQSMQESILGEPHDEANVEASNAPDEEALLPDQSAQDNIEAARDAASLLGSLLPFNFTKPGDEAGDEAVSDFDSDPFADERTDAEREDLAREIESMEPPTLEPELEHSTSDWETGIFASSPSQRCPRCRTTWDRMREDGRAGCPACYEAFAESIASTLERLQSASQHVGKAPRAATRRRRRLEHLRARRDNRLAMLRERLKVAVAAQDFEEAAKLRDKIRIVESTIVEPE